MALLERVATLIKANLNDLVDKAENPEKLLKQLLLDMQNQFLQVKTQVAIAIADQHLLDKKRRENIQAQQDWVRKAELAVAKNQEDLARNALERSLIFENAAKNFAQQYEDQSHQVQLLKDALSRLEQKMSDTKTKAEMLAAQHRRARVAVAGNATGFNGVGHDAAFGRMQAKVLEAEARGEAEQEMTKATTEEQFRLLERNDQVDRMLSELKARIAAPGELQRQ
jgi:phage shock protein A